jgi:hypothetical protein
MDILDKYNDLVKIKPYFKREKKQAIFLPDKTLYPKGGGIYKDYIGGSERKQSTIIILHME